MVLLSGCSASISDQPNESREGFYEIIFDLGEVQCPTRWEISKSGVTIINAEERIEVSDYKVSGDSASFVLPVFGTTVDFQFTDTDFLKGFFRNPFRKGDYKVAFTGYKKENKTSLVKSANIQSTYDVNMDPLDDPYKAIGIFNFNQDIVSGTFLTETGDYRFLEGKKTSKDEFYLSCFDGSHLFYFYAKIDGDSINGKFYSGNHWNATWNGVLNESISLADPNSLTYLNQGETSVQFTGIDMNKDTLKFNSMNFNKVSIIQILGTWCPNCMDETRYYSKLAKKYEDDLNIISLAFERPSDLDTQLKNIKVYQKELEVNYPIYLSGNANKSEASQMFSELNGITSFPTTIFIDKMGMVRKIHTGFYGPSTGKYYTDYVKESENFLDGLIGE